MCEEAGWPNVTHDGQMMYENTFSTDRAEVVRWAYNNAVAGVEWRTRSVNEAREKLAMAEADLERLRADVEKLDKMLANNPPPPPERA